jgi:hypothetical protein
VKAKHVEYVPDFVFYLLRDLKRFKKERKKERKVKPLTA